MSDRYVQAVRARRAELRTLQARLSGGHRAELRSCLALIKLAASADLAAALAGLGREIRGHVDRADRPGRERLPAAVLAAVDDLQSWARRRWVAAARPAVRRVATERSLPIGPSWPAVPAVRPPDAALRPPPPEPPPRPARAVLAGAADGAGAWRLALLPAAGLPVVGLPAAAGPATLPLAVGIGVAAVLGAGWTRAAVADRARLRRWADEVLSAARAAGEAELGRLLIELERAAGADLDAAVARRRADIDAELAALVPGRPAEVHGAQA
jgi:hypothetical protein